MAGRRGRKAVVVELTDGEREELEGVVRRGKSRQDLVLRCKIVLAAADGMANVDIAGELGCTAVTVSKWRKRFVEHRTFGLDDAPRSGAPRSITDEMVDKVVVKTLEETPANATRWSKRSMAAAVGMSPYGYSPDLAGVRFETASCRRVQNITRSPLRG